MTECSNCDNTGWVCEGHSDRPYEEFSARTDACGCGPGVPCEECNPCDRYNPPRLPPGFKEIIDLNKGWLH